MGAKVGLPVGLVLGRQDGWPLGDYDGVIVGSLDGATADCQLVCWAFGRFEGRFSSWRLCRRGCGSLSRDASLSFSWGESRALVGVAVGLQL